MGSRPEIICAVRRVFSATFTPAFCKFNLCVRHHHQFVSLKIIEVLGQAFDQLYERKLVQ
jgi:hypothetical protein